MKNFLLKIVWFVLYLNILCMNSFAADNLPHGISADNTLNTSVTDNNGNFFIEKGTLQGNNLFHSFDQFNLHKGETATFQGDYDVHVENIISRITGPNYSWIDGNISSNIDSANLFLINPNGFVFGPNASIQIPGSFYVSTADFLKFDENEKFYSQLGNNDILSIASPSAFGFLDHDIGNITISGKGEQSKDVDIANSGFFLSKGKTFSLIGGDITIDNGSFYITEEKKENSCSFISVPEGNIMIVSVASSGEINFSDNERIELSGQSFGNIDILDRWTISVSENKDKQRNGGGNIHLYGDSLYVRNSFIRSETYGADDGGNITIKMNNGDITFTNGSEINGNTKGIGNGTDVTIESVSGDVIFADENSYGKSSAIYIKTYSTDCTESDQCNAGSLNIKAKNVSFINGSVISTNTKGIGRAGDVSIYADDTVQFIGEGSENGYNKYGGLFSIARTESTGGDAGNIDIEATNLLISDGCQLMNSSFGQGKPGYISIKLSGNLSIIGANSYDGWASTISAASNPNGDNVITEDSGKIDISAKSILLEDGGYIATSSIAPANAEGGNAGDINIITEIIKMKGANPYGETEDGYGSGIYSRSKGIEDNVGQGGYISIKADALIIEDGAVISTETSCDSNGGGINIEINDNIDIKGDSSNITVQPPKHAQIKFITNFNPQTINHSTSGIYSTSTNNQSENSGSGGTISIIADSATLDKGNISTSTEGKGNAGQISIHLNQLIMKNDASVSSSSRSAVDGGDAGKIHITADKNAILFNSSITTDSISSGGGNISINSKKNVILTRSNITTDVKDFSGNGGDIFIENPEILILNKSIISANSYMGDGGFINILSNNFIKSFDSSVTAISIFGTDGQVHLSSDTAGLDRIVPLTMPNFLNADEWLKRPCSERYNLKADSFILNIKDGVPFSPDDFIPSPLIQYSMLKYLDIPKPLIKSEQLFLSGNYLKAIESWNNEMPIIETMYCNLYLHTKLYIALSYQNLGYYQKAISILNCETRFLSENKQIQAMYYNLIGDIYLSTGKLLLAKKTLDIALSKAISTNNKFIISSVLNNLGNLYSVNRKYNDAKIYYNDSLNIYGEQELHSGYSFIPKVFINLIRSSISDSNILYQKNFKVVTDNALSYLQKMPDTFITARDLLSISFVFMQLFERSLSLDKNYANQIYRLIDVILKRISIISKNISNHRLLAYHYGLKALLLSLNGKTKESMQNARQAVFYAQKFPELYYYWQWKLAQLFTHEKQFNNAFKAYQASINTLYPYVLCDEWLNSLKKNNFTEGIKYNLTNGIREQRDIFVKPIFQELIELLLNQNINIKNYSNEYRLKKTIDLMDIMKITELKNHFNDECLDEYLKKNKKLNKPPLKTAILYPIVLKDKLSILLCLPETIIQKDVIVTAKRIEDLSETLREYFDDKKYDIRYESILKNLNDIFINPVQDELDKREISTLIIVPDKSHCFIPFCALYDGKKYLVQKYALGIIPCMTLVDPAPNIFKDDDSILMCGLSQDLPFSTKELQNINRLFSMNGLILRDDMFTKNAFINEFNKQDYSLIHFATHGEFGTENKYTHLKSFDGDITMNDLENVLKNKIFSKTPVQLITFSACNTALKNKKSALGIAGVAIKAGARSALATLWTVDDEAIQILSIEFYRQLIELGTTRAKALQKAQQLLLTHEKYKHPKHWSAYVIIGNWM